MNHLYPVVPFLSVVFFLAGSAAASTHVGEMIVLESSGPEEPLPNAASPKRFGRTLKARMLFREYFSTPSLATPTDEFDSTGSGGAWMPNRTMFFVDGRPVRYDVGARMLKPGTVIYYFINRRVPHFISIHTHARPISGQLALNKGDSLVLRRLIGYKFESSGVVYVDQQAPLAADARFFLDGGPADAEQCLAENRLIRVLAAQPLTLSAFTDDALLTHEQFDPDHVGTRAGFLTESNSDTHTIKSLGKQGWSEAMRSGGQGILDGQFLFDKSPVVQPGNQVVAFCNRGRVDQCFEAIMIQVCLRGGCGTWQRGECVDNACAVCGVAWGRGWLCEVAPG